MKTRREFLAALSAVALPAPALRAAAQAPRTIRITGAEVVVTNPGAGSMSNYVLVKILTNQQGLYGWGDATCTGSEQGVAAFLREHLVPALINQNPMDTERLWQTLYHLPYYRSGSVHMSALSGVDMALWDIKGKVANLPVYELLGGKVRTRLLTYIHASGRTVEDTEQSVRGYMEKGYKVIRAQVAVPGAEAGYGVASSSRQNDATRQAYEAGLPPAQLWDAEGYIRIVPKLFAHLRKTVGDDIGLLHDVHERVTPAQALGLCKAVEPYNLFFFEDPLRPEHLDTFRHIRANCTTRLAMGEIYTGAWEGADLISEHLIDYVRHDLVHCGGITTGKKTAIYCERYGIESAWHGPGNISPIAHMANWHVSLSIPNFGIQEYIAGWPEPHKEVFSAMPVVKDGYLHPPNEAPGLGIDINEAAAKKWPYVRRLRPTITLSDGTPWAY